MKQKVEMLLSCLMGLLIGVMMYIGWIHDLPSWLQ